MDLDNDELKMTKEHNLRLGQPKKVVLCGDCTNTEESGIILQVRDLLSRLNVRTSIISTDYIKTYNFDYIRQHIKEIIPEDTNAILYINGDYKDKSSINNSTFTFIVMALYSNKPMYLLNNSVKFETQQWLLDWGVKCCNNEISVLLNDLNNYNNVSNGELNVLYPVVSIQPYNGIDIMKNIELACRTCYRSEGSVTQDSYKRLIKNCIKNEHESVLEHEKITIKMLCDVGVYKDLTRHRIASFSIESTRYCNYSKDKFNNKINFIRPVFYTDSWIQTNYEGSAMTEEELKSMYWYNCMEEIQDTYMKMSKLGCTPDEMRMILPHSTAAYVTMTANIREWRHILKLRCSSHTHPAVQQIMIPVLLNFKYNMPELFEDIEYNTQFPKDKLAKLEQVVVEE